MTEEHPLSEREIEVLQYVAAGLTNREIAQKLTISHNTVKVHLSNIFEKINVASRTEATVYAIEHRIVDVPGGESGQQTGALSFLRQVKWYWLAIGALLLIFLIAILTRALFPVPTPPQTATADVVERWKELAPMPEARQGMAAVAFDGKIYTLAGEGPDGVSGSVFRYLPEEDRWETLSDKPTPVTDVEGVVIGEKIYITGGKTADGKPTDTLEIYDPQQDTWEIGAPLPQALSAYALSDFEGKMYVFGGWDGKKALDTVWIYEPLSGSWEKGKAMNQAVIHSSAVTLSDGIVLIGGQSNSTEVDNVFIYYPSRDNLAEEPWENISNLPDGRYDFGAAALSDSIYIIGGLVGDDPDNSNMNSGYIYYDGDWQPLDTIKDFNGHQMKIQFLNSMLYLLESDELLTKTEFWVFRALYYDIYIPYLP